MSAALVLFPAVLPQVWATASVDRPLPPGGSEGLQLASGSMGLQPTGGSMGLQLTGGSEGLQPTGGSEGLQLTGGSMGLQPHESGMPGKGFSPGSLAIAARRIGPARVVAMQPANPTPEPLRTLQPELAFYRKYTEGMLRRYMKLSMESGRVPSLLGRELFRGHVTSYKVTSFEDVVIFVHDVGNCLKLLDRTQQELIRRIALQEYTQGETAGLLRISLKTVKRKYAEALDELTGIFLERKMLEPLKSCQGVQA